MHPQVSYLQLMNTPSNYQQFCNDWLNSWTGNKPEDLLKFYTPDAFYSDPANPEGLKGHDAMRPYFSKLLAKNPEWKWTATEIFAIEKGFTLKWQANIPVNGRELILQGLDIVEMQGGQISRNEVYFDRVPWMQLAGVRM